MKEENINTTGLHFHIEEYGKIVRQYSDTNLDSFMKTSRSILDEHLQYKSKQAPNEVKNITIRFYTF